MAVNTINQERRAADLEVVPHGDEHSAVTQPPARIVIQGLYKSFRRQGGAVVNAVDGIDLKVGPGEIVVLLGPSGCGKTTLLRCVAGLETPTAGEISIDGREVFSSTKGIFVRPEHRALSMMFQTYALWPHMTVKQNVGYPLASRGVKKAEINERVAKILDVVGVGDLANQRPGSLSGGQQQRVALARCLVVDPAVVLFDEPLSNVDAKVREALRFEILEMQQRLAFSAVYVTHDQDEAMRLGTRIAVLSEGTIEQVDTPQEVYTKPQSQYVAQFVGTLNEWPATVTEHGGEHLGVATPVGVLAVRRDAHPELSVGDEAVAIARPECLQITPAGTVDRDHLNQMTGTVTAVMFLGTHTEYVAVVEGQRLIIRGPAVSSIAIGDDVVVSVDASDIRVLPRP